MSVDGLWIGQVAMTSLMNIAFAFAVGSALLAAWLAKDGGQTVAPARPALLRAQRALVDARRLCLESRVRRCACVAADVGCEP